MGIHAVSDLHGLKINIKALILVAQELMSFLRLQNILQVSPVIYTDNIHNARQYLIQQSSFDHWEAMFEDNC